ncbi:MAG TPA: ABC transporter substrate-binding protein, partial [Dehalococcoidia bacterium]|nr:ABC transporter substrate-binding protein [Dehalococcoidia bacterium]
MKRYFPAILALVLAAALLAACGDDDDQPSGSATSTPAPDHVTFMAGFKPQANLPFVGAYVAKEKGFFAEHGLDVDIQHVTTPGDNFPLLAAGTVQFSTADAGELLSKRAGDPSLPLVSVALIGQVGQQGFAVLADSGINSPADWVGKTAGYKADTVPPDYLAILDANHIERDSITETRVGYDPAALTEGLVDIYPVFVSNEPDTLQRMGYTTKVFTAANYGAPTLGLTYVTTEDYLKDHEDIARRFVKAALEGIAYADAHRDETIDIVLQYAPGEDRDHQRYMLNTELDMAKTGVAASYGIGY